METMMRKLQQRYRRAIEEMEKWDEQQAHILSSFTNASSIIDRLQVLGESKNYGSLQNVIGMKAALLTKQLESLETYFCQMSHALRSSKGVHNSNLLKNQHHHRQSSASETTLWIHTFTGTKVLEKVLAFRLFHSTQTLIIVCVTALSAIFCHGLKVVLQYSIPNCWHLIAALPVCTKISVHRLITTRFALKSVIISSLSWNCSSSDTADLRRLLIDQSNIPKDEVQLMLDLVFADEIS